MQDELLRCSVDDPRLPRRLYMFLALVALLMMAHYYPLMPEHMAAHFRADGFPNGWQPRESFFLLMIFISASSAVVTFFAPWQSRRKQMLASIFPTGTTGSHRNAGNPRCATLPHP